MSFLEAKLFVVPTLALLSTGFSTHSLAQVVFESATGSATSQGISMGSENWLFHNFEITETIENPEVGMYLETYAPTQVFAAIVELDGETDVPDSIDLSTSDLLGTAIFDVPTTGSAGADRSGIMPLTLQPGWYALGFGTGAFAIPDGPFVGALSLETDTAPNANPYGQFQDNHPFHPNTRHFYAGFATRFFVANSAVPGDANGDGKVDGLDYIIWAMNFGDDPADDPPGSPENGDFNDDGIVNGLDYVQWATNFGQGPNDGVAVPELGAWVMALLACFGSLSVPQRQRD